ncbi:hypothetical protein GCM10009558_085190 [Virgisporangium aurantiacum]
MRRWAQDAEHLGFHSLATINLILSGVMTIAAAIGFGRASRGSNAARFVAMATAAVVAAALSRSSVGVPLLWLAVVAGWAWLLAASAGAYRTVPHPEVHRRVAVTT